MGFVFELIELESEHKNITSAEVAPDARVVFLVTARRIPLAP